VKCHERCWDWEFRIANFELDRSHSEFEIRNPRRAPDQSGNIVPMFISLLLALQLSIYGYDVVRTYPHDRTAYTQGLIYLDGFLYEGTGLNGYSTVRKVKLDTGEVVQKISLPFQHFGEGLTAWRDSLIQLTWKSGIGFVYDRTSFQQRRTFPYTGEGWGLTHDGKRLIMSDGTAALRFLDPQTFQETGRIMVRDGNALVTYLNELEYVRGEIYANVYGTDRIVRVSPSDGRVLGWIDLRGLLSEGDRRITVDVLNGIAWDDRQGRLFVTGKLWPKLFEIKLRPAK
jgi:glutamine cyclotransferase